MTKIRLNPLGYGFLHSCDLKFVFIMLIVKLIVLLVYIMKLNICLDTYCAICANHTLCLYSTPGPNIACKSYDVNALLTERDIDGILTTINERRNFIATGLSNFIPQAANMRKVVWSSELASIAQRWVDQCDLTTESDKEDLCRDLVHTSVGQNIASIFDAIPGVYIKSFVELWFIPILKYRGNVSYYNQSKAHGTDYFTQLIWAETEFVGCGKARFYATSRNMMVERLVCNFAPKGNIYAKPIYAVGYPSTQCPIDMKADHVFQGLCTQENSLVRKHSTTPPRQVNSLLRILNLSNNSKKQEIDPLRNFLKQNNNDSSKINEIRNQKMRHVYFNNTQGGVKRLSPLESHNFWTADVNNSYRYYNPIEKGLSRGYVSYQHNQKLHNQYSGSDISTQNYSNGDFWKQDFAKQTMKINSDGHLIKHKNPLCTRKVHTTEKKCTRGENFNVYDKTNYKELIKTNTVQKTLQNNDGPYVQQTTMGLPNPKQCYCNMHCHCLNTNYPLTIKNVTAANSSDFLNYNFFRNIVLCSKDLISSPEVLSSVPWLLTTSTINKSIKTYNRTRKYYNRYYTVKGNKENQSLKLRSHNFASYFDSSKRKKRELEHQTTAKPFWQREELNYNNPSELKSLRYTTLGNRKGRKSKRTTYGRNTESITISLNKISTKNSHQNHVTEKYLSFEELMHLRKITATDMEIDVHRRAGIAKQGDTTVTTSHMTTTSEYTTNTPFIRKKHCTRKLTCTWTAFPITGPDGNTINPMDGRGSLDRGSRTPPGYVEGCSRTSTCTREFMDRNQMASITEEGSLSSDSDSTLEDNDYCERRSLNIRRRDSDQKRVIYFSPDYQTSTNYPISSSTVFKKLNSCYCNA